MQTITFKLDDDLAARLKRRAEQTKAKSLHKQAKQIVIDYLHDSERGRVLRQMAELQREVMSLREDFATAVTVLLCGRGKSTPEEAKAWVAKRFL